jgi:hypothetical protein
MLTNNKNLRKVLRAAERIGWRFTGGGQRHIKGRHPNGQTTTMSSSPGDQRSILKVQRYLKVR